jgi:hypothetical protein
MTAREVLCLLTPDQRAEIALICIETMDVDTLYPVLQEALVEDELLELGLRIKHAAVA